MSDPSAGAASHHGVVAPTRVMDDRTRVLKHNDTFAVFDHTGDVDPGGLGEQGLFHDGTRHLSGLRLELDGQRPFVLGSSDRRADDHLAGDLTYPHPIRGGRVEVPLGTLHLARKTFLWRGACYQHLRVRNHKPGPVAVTLALHFRSDFADIYEIRGARRPARGEDRPPEVGPGR